MFGTYQRLGTHVSDSNVEVVRRALRVLKPAARRDRAFREERHAFLRAMIECHQNARNLYRSCATGRFI